MSAPPDIPQLHESRIEKYRAAVVKRQDLDLPVGLRWTQDSGFERRIQGLTRGGGVSGPDRSKALGCGRCFCYFLTSQSCC